MMGLYVDLSIHKIEVVKPKRDLKPVLKLQEKVDRTLPKDEYYCPTEFDEMMEGMKGDYILLGVYDKDKLIAASFATQYGSLPDFKPVTDYVDIPVEKAMNHEFVIVDMDYRGNGLQKRFMDATMREARKLGYEYMWCCAHPDNTPSVCSIEASGYKCATTVQIGDWTRNIYYRSITL